MFPTDDDEESFEHLIGEVRRLKSDRVSPHKPPLPTEPLQTLADERRVLSELGLSDPLEGDAESGEAFRWCRNGLRRELDRMRRGDYVIRDELDLHGLIAAEASRRVARFISQSVRDDRNCVRIIHGKGLRSPGRVPVLRAKIAGWLSKREEVLAFCSSPRLDGGTGAVYVLLARKKRR